MHYLLYPFLMLMAFLFMSMYDLYSAFLLALLFFLVPLLLLGLGWWAARTASLTLTAPARGRQGERVEICVTAKGALLPFVSSLTCFVGEAEYDSYEKEKGEIRFYFQQDMPHCGLLSLAAPRISFRDPFGLFHFRKEGNGASLLVLPKVMGKRDVILSRLLSQTFPEEKEYFGATPYTPGDNPHLINWKVTARKEDMYVRDSSPAGAAQLILAADYENNADLRDTVASALYSAGLALTSAHRSFHFAWATKAGVPILSAIESEGDWEDAIIAFLRQGSAGALQDAKLPPLSICYITGHTEPRIAVGLSPVIWCAAEGNRRAQLSGKTAIVHALGGELS